MAGKRSGRLRIVTDETFVTPGRLAVSPSIRREARTILPTEYAQFDMQLFVDEKNGHEHVALVLGDVDAASAPTGTRPPLVRIHSECLTGDALGSRRCDCGDQLRASQRAIAAEGRGVIIYVRGHEGRGIGLTGKLKAYELQDSGLDTVDANHRLGFPVDARDYAAVAAILAQLNVPQLRLLSSNRAKFDALTELGVDVVSRVPLIVAEHPENIHYLSTKRDRMGHDRPLETDQVWSELLEGRISPEHALTADAQELVSRYGPLLAAGSQLVLAQLGQSADGFIAARTGDSNFVTGPADREHLQRLRALVDAVVVGVGTVGSDDCRLTVRDVEGPNPVRVVLDPAARAPVGSVVFTDGAAPTMWFIGPDAEAPKGMPDQVEIVRLPVKTTASGIRFDPAVVLIALAERGLGRVLVEGGGRIVSAFLSAGVLDRLFLTTAPVLIGDGVPGLRFSGSDKLSDALRAPARRFLFGADTCMEFDLASIRKAR